MGSCQTPGGCGPEACAGTYRLSGCCTGPAFSCPVANPNSQYVNSGTISSVAPPGMVPIQGVNGVAYPLKVTGAILSPYDADVRLQGYPLIISSINVVWDPVYSAALNQHAPVSTRSWEGFLPWNP